ncbi:MAG TPA: carboxypeptidase regulatory-like domain-containing protein [Bryobacteraceae bacterium]|nr:carboxypeptidase regulatory-like domain-containing protein [Bryobacteraceae bacterium]
MKTLRSLYLLSALSGLILPHSIYAQAITAKVVGAVTDASGAAVPAVTVTIRSVQTNQARTTKTNEAGAYEFSFLPIGEYTLSFESPGFQRSEVSRFQLNVDQVARIDMQLTVGEISEKISVEASAVGLQTENATVGSVIDSQKVVELPLNGRSFVQLALLTPGVNPGTPGSITVRRNRGSVGQQVGMSANGARDTQNRFYYDGIEAMDLDSYNFSFSPSVDAIQEFRVDTSTYSAEVGGAPGGQVNLMTKSGTSQFHGGAWEFNRNDAFAALAPFQPYTLTAKPPRLNRNQFGANIGGPVFIPKVLKNKESTFFFFNWESGRQVSGSFGPTAFVPPAAYRTGNFSGSSVTIYDPSTGQPFPGNIIPSNRIQSYATKFLTFVPASNTNETAINYRAPAAAAPITQDQYVSRMDHRFSDKNSLYGSYMFNTQADNTVPLFPLDTRGNRGRAQNLSLTDTHVFSASIVNEVRVGWDRFFEHEFFGTTGNADYDVSNLIGIPGVSKDPRNYGYPTFSGAGFDFPVTRGIGPRDRLNQLWQGGDNISIRKGTHFMKAGAVVARRNWTFDESVNPRGSFSFDGRTTSGGANPVRENGFASFLLGLATAAQVSVEPFATRMNNWSQSYYLQDNWKISRTLTLNLGMRYEYFGRPVQRGKATNFDLNGAVPGFVPSRQTFHGFPDIGDTSDRPSALVYNDKNNFGPRFGIAYTPAMIPDFVVRAGYGIYYTPEITNSWTTLTLNPPIVKTFDFAGTFDRPLQVATAFAAQGQAGVGLFGSGALDPNLRDTYTQQWNLTVQKKLPGNMYLDVGYVGSKGTNLTLAFDGNRPIQVVTPGPTVAPLASRRPLQGFSAISTAKAIGNSSYHSLQTKLERRVARGLSLLASYTWAKNLSNADISTVGGGTMLGGIQNYFNLQGERSPSVFDIRHRLSIAAIYDLPIFNKASNSAVRALLGGWQLGAIITEQTGFSSFLSGVGDTTGTGVNSRPTVVPGQKAELDRGERSRERWFNTSAFMQTPLGQFGNAARQAIHLPGLNQVDASATKNFRIRERNNFQFRAEFFNFINHVNLGSPGLSVQAPNTFGRITTSSQGAGVSNDGRVVQFALKYQF